MAVATFKIQGMDCAEEVKALKAELSPVEGVGELTFDILKGKMTVVFDEARVGEKDLQAAVARTGMTAAPWIDPTAAPGLGGAAADARREARRRRWGRAALTAASGLLTVFGYLVHGSAVGFLAALGEELGNAVPAAAADALAAPPGIPLAARLLYVAAIVAGGWFVLPKAWRALRRLRPDMNLLMTLAVAGAAGIGAWLEAATVAFLFSLSLSLESWSVGRARRAVAALMDLSPPKARVYCPHDKREELVDVDRVAVGATVIVKPGEKFPLDGIVTRGETTVNQAPITGESALVAKTPGDEVFAGSINEDGAIEFRATRPASDTTLARIIRMVEEAQGRRAPSEQWVDAFAKYYTPIVMGLAVAVTLVPPVFAGAAWATWFYRALVLLVIACPCALVISTPVAIVAALASAARHGALIKGGRFVEAPARLRAIAFDKTGTLTEGRPAVREVIPLNRHTAADLLSVASALEWRSEHPIARAILRRAHEEGIAVAVPEQFTALRGRGAVGRVNGRAYWIGSHRYMHEREQDIPDMHRKLEELSSSGVTVLALGTDDHVCGFITVADRVRGNAADAIAGLRAAGVAHIAMVTGDNRETAEAIARETGVDAVHAELLPQDKVAAIEKMVVEYGDVCMVGDGVNDAPAMARSSLAIAMGAAGSDAAIETADIALMSDDLSRIAWLIHHSRRTLRTIRTNIALSIGIKAVFVAATFGGFATLWAAIAADMGVSLLVVANALQLLRDRGTESRTPARFP